MGSGKKAEEEGKAMSEIMKSWRVRIFLIALLLSFFTLMIRPVQLGMDFSGGSLIQINLDRPLSSSEMQTVVNVLQSRLNNYGLKQLAVKPWGKQFVVVEITKTSDPKEINRIQALLGEQGKFETLYNGKVVLRGEDIISVITDPQKGYGAYPSGNGYTWTVPFLVSNKAAEEFAKAVEGECTPLPNSRSCKEQVYMFIDRPENAIIVMPPKLYEDEREIPDDFIDSPNKIKADDLLKNSGIDLAVADQITEELLEKIRGKNVIVPEGAYDSYFLKALNGSAANVKEIPKRSDYWLKDAINIENIVHLTPGVTSGKPITNPSITGYAATKEKAAEELSHVAILLKSGRLPVSVSIGSVSTISPILSERFISYSVLAGLAALMVVATVLLIRYRKIKIALSIAMTSFSELIILLAVAALIGWQIDLPAVAGIIAAIGTGVDHQIVITDEALRKEKEVELSLITRIKKAFSIIFMAATTTIFAMLPLLVVGMGTLKGFAITTILGMLIGVFIARPAYAEIVNRIID
ncbi:hypothetical protein DRN74_00935 [Candidatus Micrarchaeota archaeon]|nr:MAG: hypothetical protein DRN74_00935 [Candidatus Micrarchaeota archaeon]